MIEVAGLEPCLLLLLPKNKLDRAEFTAGGSVARFDARVAAAYEASVTETWQLRHQECGPIVPIAANAAVDVVTARLVNTIVEHTSVTAVLTA